MRAPRSFGLVATAFLSLSPLASAWPSWLPELNALIVRDDATTPSATPTATPKDGPTGTAANTFNLNTGAVETGTTQPSATDGGGGGKGNSTRTGTSTSKHTMFNPQDSPGSVVMITPGPYDPMQLYKIGSTVTWAWNYTGLQGTPTAINVLASCSVASRTYTLTQNMTFATQAAYSWDTGSYQNDNPTNPLLTEQYTLIIYDADSSVNAVPEAGYLGTANSLVFGLYEKQKYTALDSGWSCASCSGAMGGMDSRAFSFSLTMCVVTVLSFTWFVTGLHIAL